jgi:flotillin
MLDLKPLTININLEHALSQQNIRINVPSTFTIGISTEPSIMQNAAERLLNLPPNQIEDMAKEIIFGQLRLTVASLTIEEINQDREAFLSLVANNVDTELHKIGLYLINVNITDITDEADYIKSIGAKAAAEAIAAADVDRANATRQGAVGQAIADREREIEVAKNQASSEKGQKSAESDRRIFVQQQEAQAVEGENISRADIASYNADLAEREASAYQRSEVAKRIAQVEIEKAQYEFEGQRLRAEEIAREEVSKQQIEIAAEAEAERQRRIASGLADATLAAYNAEAEGQRAVLEAKAEGYAKLVKSAGGDAKAAATLLMVEKIEGLVARQTEAIANLKIDKITVWDSGNNAEGGGSTSNFVSSLMQSLPPVHDVAKMAGVDLPDYLGSMKEE